MGNSEQGLASSNVISHLSKRFVISPHPLDLEQSMMFYLHEKLSDNKYILKIISTNDTDDKQKMEDLICKKLAMNKNLSNKSKNHVSLIPIDYYLFQEDKGYCNSFSKCYVVFDLKNSQPLNHFLVRGAYSQNLANLINEQMIYKGLLNLIEGVALLRFFSHPHRHINCDTVYYDKDENTFLLADPWISPLTDLHQQYHSPQKLRQMNNQLQRHDPYIADLFSIGMVGLKILGHNNLLDYYTIHKTIDQRGLTKLTQSIKNINLRTLIMRLLNQNIQVREDVLTQVRTSSNSAINLAQSQSSATRTRNLSGKVASVRKSFVNQSRPVYRHNVIPDINNQNNIQNHVKNTNGLPILYTNTNTNSNNQNYYNQTNPFLKVKQPQLTTHTSLKTLNTPYQNSYQTSNQTYNSTFKSQPQPQPQLQTNPSTTTAIQNDKPDIDIGNISKNLQLKVNNNKHSNQSVYNNSYFSTPIAQINSAFDNKNSNNSNSLTYSPTFGNTNSFLNPFTQSYTPNNKYSTTNPNTHASSYNYFNYNFSNANKTPTYNNNTTSTTNRNFNITTTIVPPTSPNPTGNLTPSITPLNLNSNINPSTNDKKPTTTGLIHTYSSNSLNTNTENNPISNSIIHLLDSKSDKLFKNEGQFTTSLSQKGLFNYSNYVSNNANNTNNLASSINNVNTSTNNFNTNSYSPFNNKNQIKKSQIYIVNKTTNQILPADSVSSPYLFSNPTTPTTAYKPQLNSYTLTNKPSQRLAKLLKIQRVDTHPEQSTSKQKQYTILPSPTNAFKKQKQNNLRTNPSFPSSQSFEGDNFAQNKIYQNLKNLQNKISQVVNQSAVHSDINKQSQVKAKNFEQNSVLIHDSKCQQLRISEYQPHNNENESKMVQSYILPKSQQASSHSTVNAIYQQIKQIKQIKQKQFEGKATKIDKHSPILVRQSEQPSLHLLNSNKNVNKNNNDEEEQHNSDEKIRKSQQSNELNSNAGKNRANSNGSKDSIDFLNLNNSKQSSDENKQPPNLSIEIKKKVQDEQKAQQIFTTPPAKQPSSNRLQRLQGNNLTIPEQSDQQSVEDTPTAAPKIKGEYVEQVYENGGKYIGYMLNNQRNGNGIFYYRDGGYYDGRWKNNMMNGYGKLFYQTGKLAYEGQWYQDQFHGRGVVYNDQPEAVPDTGFDYRNMNQSQNYWLYYQGDLSHDMKARYGKLMLSNGEYYEGQFKNDQVHGKGQFHRFDGVSVKGIWSQGVFMKQL